MCVFSTVCVLFFFLLGITANTVFGCANTFRLTKQTVMYLIRTSCDRAKKSSKSPESGGITDQFIRWCLQSLKFVAVGQVATHFSFQKEIIAVLNFLFSS